MFFSVLVPESLFENEKVVLEFDGLDTAAEVVLQDTIEVGRAQNMFSKYFFDITNYSEQLKGDAKLSVIFRSPVNFSRDQYDSYIDSYGYEIPPECLDPAYQGECHVNMIRKMQASFSWDWGPAFPNVGIWKSWRIVGWSSVKLSSLGVFPKPDVSLPNKKDSNLLAPWTVNFRVYFDLASNVSLSGTLQISVGDTEYFNSEVVVNENSFVEDSFKIPENTVETWWPNGYGNQPLYDIIVTFTPNDFPDDGVSSLMKRIGFRMIELDQSFVDDSDQSIGRHFRAVVNNVTMFMLGSNWIPAHVLPEQVTPPYTRLLLEAARDTHQNCLRVWGGGIYESDEFYEFADEFGLLIWEDMMFASSMYPADDNFLESVRSETRTQIRRLQHHPCIILWATNNENEANLRSNWFGTNSNFTLYKSDYIKLYVDTVANTIKEEDPSRTVLISSPSNGIESEEEGYVAENPSDNHYGDTHFYDYSSNGWSWEHYPTTRFASEYGFQSFPSYQTLLPVFSEEDMQIGSPMMEHRQHHPNGQAELDQQLSMHFDYNQSNATFNYYLYLTQIHQAMAIKTETEFYRRIRDTLYLDGTGLTMGALYWQLNDVWQGPSWASLEYGGRWKILHNFAKNFFSPLAVVPWIQDGILRITIVNDSPDDLSFNEEQPKKIEINLRKISGENSSNLFSYELTSSVVSQSAYEAVSVDLINDLQFESICSSGSQSGDPYQNCFISVSFKDYDNTPLSPDNFLLLSEPKDYFLPEVQLEVTASQLTTNSIDLSLSADHVTLFVFLESPFEGVFSDNGFIIPVDEQISVTFNGRQATPVEEFQNTLNITYVRNYYY
ncbi:UNVERIFIED_CONTAM: hypothetical protein RMT77_019512 [Armadillidium vulgare]